MVDEPFISKLTTTDWNEEWKRMQMVRRHADDATIWDEKAKTFPVKHGSQEGYVKEFLQHAQIRNGETVFDMGCGTGALATPLAKAGHRVIACDFSQGMIGKMLEDQRELGITGIDARIMSWADNWEACGIKPKSVDVAIASRSIVTSDLRESLLKLNAVARRRCCITLPCGPSPRTDERLLAAVGVSQQLGRDFLYAFNILASMGINPEVAYIESARMELFDTFDEACDKFTAIVQEACEHLVSEKKQREIPQLLREWLSAHLVHDQRGWHLSEDRKVTWAFISWKPL